jgi:hypothetical protein
MTASLEIKKGLSSRVAPQSQASSRASALARLLNILQSDHPGSNLHGSSESSNYRSEHIYPQAGIHPRRTFNKSSHFQKATTPKVLDPSDARTLACHLKEFDFLSHLRPRDFSDLSRLSLGSRVYASMSILAISHALYHAIQ